MPQHPGDGLAHGAGGVPRPHRIQNRQTHGLDYKARPNWAWGIAAALGAVFVALVVKHGFITAAELELGQRKLLVQAGQRRMLGEEEPEDPHRKRVDDPHGARFLVAEHPYAGDLDIFGPGSLFVAMSRAETAVGEETLAR